MHLIDSICAEMAAWRSGRFPPYQKMGIMIAVATCVAFSVIFQHGEIFEGQIAVIDLDNSTSSTRLIEKIDSSSYIDVDMIYHQPISVGALTANDRNLGILYIPRQFEHKLKNGHESVRIGYFADYSNPQQNANIISSLTELVAREGAELAASRLGAKGVEVTESTLNPLSVGVRRLYNPTMAATPETVMPFINFFSSLILGLTTLMIIGRLKVTGEWTRTMEWGAVALISRLLPYALIYTAAISLTCAVLVNFGQMPFAGNYLAYVPSIFMTALCIGLLAFNFSFHTRDPSGGPQFMILFVPPGFIMGGATMAVGVLPLWMYHLSYAFPLVWQYRFFRDFAFRGEGILAMSEYYGYYLLYLIALAALLTFRVHRERLRLSPELTGLAREDSRLQSHGVTEHGGKIPPAVRIVS